LVYINTFVLGTMVCKKIRKFLSHFASFLIFLGLKEKQTNIEARDRERERARERVREGKWVSGAEKNLIKKKILFTFNITLKLN